MFCQEIFEMDSTKIRKRKSRGQKDTWRMTIDTEMKAAGYDWNSITRIVNKVKSNLSENANGLHFF